MLYLTKIFTDQILIHAINSIDQIVKTRVYFSNDGTSDRLIDMRDLLQQLLEPNSPTNERTDLFYRQLNRFMHYNRSLPEEFWLEVYNDMLYLFESNNNEKINFEKKLKQREFQFHQIFGKQKCFREFFNEHKTFFQNYLHECILLNSKIQVRSLIDNIDHLLHNVYKQTDLSLTTECKKLLNEKLECIEIDLDSSNRKLSLDLQFSINNGSYEEIESFVPSKEQLSSERCSTPEEITDVLRSNRWIVILGDPGSGKTTLLRWIMNIFAQTALNNNKEDDYFPLRIPILIRISQFASWHIQNQNKTLIDYMEEHYSGDESKNVLKQLIYHGHTLILLDGLDEILEIGRSREIVDLIKNFIDEYVRSSDYLSAFDNKIFNINQSYSKIFYDTEPPNMYGGNQIIITSRIIGFRFFSIIGPYIKYCTLSLIDHTEAKEFIKNWLLQVDNSILNILSNEQIKFDEDTLGILLNRRNNAIDAIFENTSKILISNPLLLSLICKFIYQLSDDFRPKSRIEIYHHIVQTALNSCENQQLNIPTCVVMNLLIELASYLHLQSPSDLIDAFDIKQLCQLILRRQNLSNNHNELREKANDLLYLLEYHVGIVSQRSLQVYSFLHLSFQEYFVAHSFLRNASINHIVERIITFTIHSRFYESLILALEWISWRWSDKDYDEFCNLLFKSNKDYIIPFGTLLFFDTFDHIQKLPSKSILFIAINNLFDHPYDGLRRRLLSWYLPKFDTNMILEWMQTCLNSNKRIFHFCQSIAFEHLRSTFNQKSENIEKLISPSVCHQLWLLHEKNSSAEFIIDQTLRKIIKSDEICNEKLWSYFPLDNTSISKIHPLILSVIVAVCGGLYINKQDGFLEINISPDKMHRESSILNPIMNYLSNNNEPHSMKIQSLIQQYENILQTFLPSDTSVDIVDIFVALICLQSVSQPSIYQKYDRYQALSIAIDRFKRTWFYLNKQMKSFGFPDTISDTSFGHADRISDNSFDHVDTLDYSLHLNAVTVPYILSITSELESIMDEFFSQSNQFDEEHMSFFSVCISLWQKLGIHEFSPWLNLFIHSNEMINRYFQSQPKFIYLMNENEFDDIITKISQDKLIFLLNYLPQSLQELYYRIIISPIDKNDSLPLIVLLLHYLTNLENVNKNDVSVYFALRILCPLLKEHMLENYTLVLFREKYCENKAIHIHHTTFLKIIDNHPLLDPFLINQSIDWDIIINIERQRIFYAENLIKGEEKDFKLLAASISLARLVQCRYHCNKHQPIEQLDLFIIKSAVMNIFNPVLRTIALSIILDMKNPLIFNDEERDELQFKMINQLQTLISFVPLMTSSLLYIFCHSTHELFPELFLQMANVIIEKFDQNTTNKQSQKAAFIALRQLNDSNLSHCLSKFAKQINNLSDVLRFNSTILFQYFTTTTSFYLSNTILLSLIYLVELTFDVEILKIYTNEISSSKKLNQLQDCPPESRSIMTFELATWITDHLERLSKNKLPQIVNIVFQCLTINKKALPLVKKWLNYRMHKDLKVLAQYAALQLTIEGIDVPDFIDMINEMFSTDIEHDLSRFIERILNSQFVKVDDMRQILIKLYENIHYLHKNDILIDLKDTFKLILDLEFERINENINQSSKPFLCMIRIQSKNLQDYLLRHLQQFVNTQNNINEEYLSVVMKWIIQSSINQIKIEDFSKELLDYIFTLLHDQRYPQVQKAILNGICLLFIKHAVWVGHFLRKRKSIWHTHAFMDENTVNHLEKLIYSSSKYSKDLLSISLLAYGRCLLMFYNKDIHRNISNELQDLLMNLIDTSSSEIISIRAALCLFFLRNKKVQDEKIGYHQRWDWFRSIWNITPEKKYRILLQQILCEENDSSSISLTELIEHLKTYSSELLGMLINEFYDYLCNKENIDYLSDPMPHYIRIASQISEHNFDTFRKTIQKTIFGEEKFKKELYLYYESKRTDYVSIISLYAAFGVITKDLIRMIESTDEDAYNCKWVLISGMQQVSDRSIIDRLFEKLDLIACSMRTCSLNSMKTLSFDSISELLVDLAQNHTVSLLEVHQRLSFIIKKILSENNNQVEGKVWSIFKKLLALSCFKDYARNSTSVTGLYTEDDINEEFRKKILDLGKDQVRFLALRENHS